MLQADLFDLFHYASDNDFQEVLPARTLQVRGQLARHQFGANHQDEH